MRKIVISIALFLLAAGWSSLRAQGQSGSPANLPPPGVAYDLSSLSIPYALRVEIEYAVSRHDFKRAETILVEESKHERNSPEAARLLQIAGSLFFLDGQYLDAAIAWK